MTLPMPRVSRTLGLALAAVLLLVAGDRPKAEESPLSVRITSPLGRTGFTGRIRIVAQVQRTPDAAALLPVRFYVDEVLLTEVEEGPPFAAEWLDEDPFARHEIAVEVRDNLGHMARDSVVLDALEVTALTETFSVLQPVSVQDPKGRYVTNVTAADFRLVEDEVPQVLELMAPEALPATYTLLIDSSQSMVRRFDMVQRAARRLMRYLEPGERILVAPFSRTLGAITGPTDDAATVADAITAINPVGGTAILECLADMTTQLDAFDGRHVLVLITDGYDEHSEVSFEESIAAIKRTHATVYVIGIGGVAGISLSGEQLLRRLASETGGRAFFPSRDEQLASVYEQVVADARYRYLVGYTPSNQSHDGTWRQITVTLANPQYSARTRPGYFAPAPPPLRPVLEFTATDAERRYLDVVVEDLIVLEDGVEQMVDSFHEAVEPVSIVLALDASGSIRKSAEAVTEAARTFVEALEPEDGLAIMSFADHPLVLHDLTTDRAASVTAIDRYQAAGGTALYDALGESLTRLDRVEGRRVVVVLTDGRDEDNPGTGPGSVRTFQEVLGQLKETAATVFAIGLGPKIDRTVLERLATESGGEAYFPADVSTLRDEYRRVVENLRRRYFVSYVSTNANRDGSWRAVEIRSRQPNVVIKSRGGYFAGEQPTDRLSASLLAEPGAP